MQSVCVRFQGKLRKKREQKNEKTKTGKKLKLPPDLKEIAFDVTAVANLDLSLVHGDCCAVNHFEQFLPNFSFVWIAFFGLNFLLTCCSSFSFYNSIDTHAHTHTHVHRLRSSSLHNILRTRKSSAGRLLFSRQKATVECAERAEEEIFDGKRREPRTTEERKWKEKRWLSILTLFCIRLTHISFRQ